MRGVLLLVGEARAGVSFSPGVILLTLCAELHACYDYLMIYANNTLIMKSQGQGETEGGKVKEFFIQCMRCHRVCYSDVLAEVTFDDETQLAIVRVNEDQALCARCLQAQIQQEMQQARTLQERFIYFKQFESSFEEREGIRGEAEMMVAQLKAGEEAVRQLEFQESEMANEVVKLRQASAQLKEQFYQLQAEEERFWEGINKIERRTSKVEQKALNTKFDRLLSRATLDELSKMSVLHLFLDIKVDDSLAYVQGMAMGRRGESADVSWEQVAVGLGHLLVGLHFLAMKYSYEYRRIQSVVLRGAMSEVMLRGKKKAYSPQWRQAQKKQFGELLQAMLFQTAFLCEHILQAESMEYSQQFRIPFLINTKECKVVDLWIDPMKLEQRMRWSSWTKAMRYFLIDFKHITTLFAINDKHL